MFDKTDEKLYIFGRKELEWHKKVTTNTKHYKIGERNTYQWTKKRCLLSCRPQLNIKDIKILTKSDFPEDMKIGIKTEFGVKVLEH